MRNTARGQGRKGIYYYFCFLFSFSSRVKLGYQRIHAIRSGGFKVIRLLLSLHIRNSAWYSVTRSGYE